MALNRFVLPSALLVSILQFSAPNLAQTPQAPAQVPTVKYEGRVLADDTGLPLPNVHVSPAVGIVGLLPVSALTDGEGRFSFSFPRVRGNLSAVKSGYARREAPLVEGQPIEIHLQPGAVVSGRVLDEYGDPVANVRVSVESSTGAVNARTVASTATDDLGEYRLGGLPEGAFFPVVVTRGRPRQVEVGNQVYTDNSQDKTYYPNARSLDQAQPLSVHFGEERSGIDFVLTTE